MTPRSSRAAPASAIWSASWDSNPEPGEAAPRTDAACTALLPSASRPGAPTRLSLAPSRRKPLLDTWLDREDPGRSIRPEPGSLGRACARLRPRRRGDGVRDTGGGRRAVSVTLEDAGDEPRLEPAPGAMPLWPRLRVRALYEHGTDLNAVRSALRSVPGVSELRVREIAERDWLAAAREDIEPIETRNALGRAAVGGRARGPHRGAARARTRLRLGAPPHHAPVPGAAGGGAAGGRRCRRLRLRIGHPRGRGGGTRRAPRAGRRHRPAAAIDAGAGASLVVANILAGPLIELAPVLGGMTGAGWRSGALGDSGGASGGGRGRLPRRFRHPRGDLPRRLGAARRPAPRRVMPRSPAASRSLPRTARTAHDERGWGEGRRRIGPLAERCLDFRP